MKTTSTSLTEYLKNLSEPHNFNISQVVAYEALQCDDPHIFFKDLLQYGCVSGMVGILVYYADTYAFFNRYYDEIEELRQEYDLIIPVDCNLKNYLAWFAFEIVAFQIYQDWENGS